MTRIQKEEYVFEVDVEKTSEYYQTHALCECEYCRNYYAQVKGKLPKLEALLAEFGVDISRPDEIMSVEGNHSIRYMSMDYTVCGKIATMGQYEIDIPDSQFISLVIVDGFASPNEQTSDYFTISVNTILELPWVLEEPFPQAIKSQAAGKIKSFLRKLFKA